jgi:AraC-like DNA-binding protein
MDVLSDVLSAVRMTGAIYFDIEASSPFIGESPSTPRIAAAIMPQAEHIISFHTVISGSCWAAIGDGTMPPVLVNAGDIVIFPGGAPNVLSSSRGARSEPNMAMYYNPVDDYLPFTVLHGGGGPERTRIICGYLGCDVRPFNPLLAALPPMLCARKPADGRDWIIDMFKLALTEGGSRRIGGETVLAKLSELMFVEVIRTHIESLPEDSRGWLSGLRDPHIGEALRFIHGHPREDWTLELLARRTGLSRTTFSARFTHYVGVSPMQYVARWRLQLAARLLERPGVSIAQAAAEVGYESQAAFNRAFKKVVGVPPGTWRKGHGASSEAVTGEAGPL